MLQSSELVAFVSTTDLARARRFYEQTLGLRCVDQDGYACVFDAGGTTLRVTAAAEVATPGYTVLGWRVTDIEATMNALAGNGVAFTRYAELDQDSTGVWVTPNGDRVAWFVDPDGNNLSLTQFTTAVATGC